MYAGEKELEFTSAIDLYKQSLPYYMLPEKKTAEQIAGTSNYLASLSEMKYDEYS